MNAQYLAVRQFHQAFGHPVANIPTALSIERTKDRSKWMIEEIGEFISASASGDVVGQADGMIDLIYFALGTLVEMGVEPEELFKIVQGANMAKLFPDGKPRYNATGKVIKPPGWVSPEPLIEAEIARQRKLALDAAGST